MSLNIGRKQYSTEREFRWKVQQQQLFRRRKNIGQKSGTIEAWFKQMCRHLNPIAQKTVTKRPTNQATINCGISYSLTTTKRQTLKEAKCSKHPFCTANVPVPTHPISHPRHP
jgi:hypothetical protein